MLMKFAEDVYIDILKQMGATDQEIKKRMKKRLILAFLMLIIFTILAFAIKKMFFIVFVIVVPILMFKNDVSVLKKEFDRFNLERELAFGKFMQLIVPYLKMERGKDTLYMIFSKLNTRVHPSLQNPLFTLMNEMVSRPGDINPFIDFAKKCSNNDAYINFMMALYDFQNSTTDVSVIEELSETANNELLKRVNDVIRIKHNKVAKFPMTMAISLAIIMIPFLLMFILYTVKSSGLL